MANSWPILGIVIGGGRSIYGWLDFGPFLCGVAKKEYTVFKGYFWLFSKFPCLSVALSEFSDYCCSSIRNLSSTALLSSFSLSFKQRKYYINKRKEFMHWMNIFPFFDMYFKLICMFLLKIWFLVNYCCSAIVDNKKVGFSQVGGICIQPLDFLLPWKLFSILSKKLIYANSAVACWWIAITHYTLLNGQGIGITFI